MSSVRKKANTKAGGKGQTTVNEDASRARTIDEDEHSSALMPEHPLFPELPPTQGELFFECTLFLYSILALFLQYLNLYKLLWWLPNYHPQTVSFARIPLKLNLVNPYLLSCVGLILGRRVTWCFLRKLSVVPLIKSEVPAIFKVAEWLLKSPMLGVIMTSFMFSLVQIVLTYPVRTLLYLVYPFIIYCVFFYRELRHVISGGSLPECAKRFWDWIQTANFVLEPEMRHACSPVTNQVRDEVSILNGDFYLKVRQGVFCALCTAYYAIFVPLGFTPNAVQFDIWWVLELCMVVASTSLLLHLSYDMNVVYCDLLHRSASHLGSWERMENTRAPQAINMPYHTWNQNVLWSDGSVVKHGRSLFRGHGTCIAAEPGNVDHSRFFYLFHEPVHVLNLLCMLDGLLIAVQFLMLVHSSEYQHIVTLVLLMLANYYLLFHLFKSKVILARIYNPNQEDDGL